MSICAEFEFSISQDNAALISDPIEFTGDARQQVARVVNRIEAITSAHPAAAQYKPGAIR